MSKSVNVDFVTRQIEVDTDGKEHFISTAMAAKDAEQSMLNAQNAANAASQIAERAEIIASALADVGWVSCTQLGLTSNDDNGNNLAILASAINNGMKILVDDMYYIKSGTTQTINKDIVIKGINPNCGFKYALNTPAFLFSFTSLCNIINIELLKFINTEKENNSTCFAYNHSDADNFMDLKMFRCKKCCFIDGATLFRVNDGATRWQNEADKLPYCGLVDIENNNIENCKSSFFVISDTAFDTILFYNNIVHNFFYVVFHSGTENLPGNASQHLITKNELLANSKHCLIVQNNYVTNDDDWIFTSNPSHSSYYCFCLAEGEKCIYSYNHVAGIKSVIPIAIYDIYGSTKDFYYENNIWENNICFTPDGNSKNNAMIKAKGGIGLRIARGNKFKVDEAWLDNLINAYGSIYPNITKENSGVRFYDSGDYNNWIIDNNTFDAYILYGESSNSDYCNVKVTNNIFDIKKRAEGYFCQCAGNFGVFSNNIVKLAEPSNFTLFNPNNNLPEKILKATGNTFINIDEAYPGFEDLTNVKCCDFTDNSIICKDGYTRIYGGKNAKNNTIECDGSLLDLYTCRSSSKLDLSGTVYAKGIRDTSRVYLSEKPSIIVLDYNLLDYETQKNYTFTFSAKVYADENGIYHITCAKDSGEIYDSPINPEVTTWPIFINKDNKVKVGARLSATGDKYILTSISFGGCYEYRVRIMPSEI